MALSTCLAAFVLLVAGAGADEGSGPLVQATIYKAGGGTVTDSVTAAQLLASPSQCPPYSGGTMDEHGRQGVVVVDPNPTDSWTVESVLGCLQTPVSLADVTGITVAGDSGAPETGPGSELTRADLAARSDFQDTAQNPVIQSLGSTDQYDRPWRGGSDLDFLDETQTTPIAINVFEGPPLTVAASASQTTVTVGATIAFSAAVTDGNGHPVSGGSYSWSFDGGAPSSTLPAPQIQFNTPGVWTVDVQVVDNGGGGGDQLTVTVNSTGTQSTPTSTGPRTTGPTASHGTTPGASAGNKSNGTTGTGGHSASSHTHSSSNKAKTSNGHTQPTTTSPSTATGSGSGASGSGSSGSPGSGSPASSTGPTSPTTTPAKAPTSSVHRTSATPPPGTKRLVTGQLVSDVIPLPAGESPLVHVVPAPSATAPARQAPTGPAVLPIVGAALAVVLLLGLGAGRELRGPRRRLVLRLGG